MIDLFCSACGRIADPLAVAVLHWDDGEPYEAPVSTCCHEDVWTADGVLVTKFPESDREPRPSMEYDFAFGGAK